MAATTKGVVTILADTAIRGGDLDEARALEAKQAAEDAIKNRASDIDYAQAQAELDQLRYTEKHALMGIPVEVAKDYGKVQENYKGSIGMEKAYINARRWLVTSFSSFDMGLGKMDDIFQAFEKYCRKFRIESDGGRRKVAILQAEDELAALHSWFTRYDAQVMQYLRAVRLGQVSKIAISELDEQAQKNQARINEIKTALIQE